MGVLRNKPIVDERLNIRAFVLFAQFLCSGWVFCAEKLSLIQNFGQIWIKIFFILLIVFC
jgi:hypothetical protein